MSSPTILIVRGSFAPPTLYATGVRLLKQHGYPAVAIQRPSTAKRVPLEPASMLEDATTIKRAAEILISLGRSVIVMAGSPAEEEADFYRSTSHEHLIALGSRHTPPRMADLYQLLAACTSLEVHESSDNEDEIEGNGRDRDSAA